MFIPIHNWELKSKYTSSILFLQIEKKKNQTNWTIHAAGIRNNVPKLIYTINNLILLDRKL